MTHHRQLSINAEAPTVLGRRLIWISELPCLLAAFGGSLKQGLPASTTRFAGTGVVPPPTNTRCSCARVQHPSKCSVINSSAVIQSAERTPGYLPRIACYSTNRLVRRPGPIVGESLHSSNSRIVTTNPRCACDQYRQVLANT